MKKLILILSIITSLGNLLQGQSARKLFIGILPDITREVIYNEEKVFSVNVLPLIAQVSLNEFTGIRLSSILNLQNNTKSISHLGGQLGIPVYLFGNHSSPVKGVYAAPVFGFSHNKISSSNEMTVALEPGYSWILSGGFTMNLGLQLGGTFFTTEGPDWGWRNHAGLKFSLGYTFRLE